MLSELFGRTQFSSGTLPLLAIGRDVPTGVFRLRGGKLHMDWQIRDSHPYYEGVLREMRRLARELDGDLIEAPFSTLSRAVTVHPLGGCAMGRNADEGVVDAFGEVFNYPGLYVADGAVMPGPVGTNPAFTIAALADRFADHLIRRARSGEMV
jgi:cholesterol oxidase